MKLENATVKTVLPVESGTNKQGNNWEKQTIIVDQPGQYPKLLALSFLGKSVVFSKALKEGDVVDCEFDVESREYNGRYYTEAKCWQIRVKSEGAAAPASGESTHIAASPANSGAPTNDLPF